MSEVHKHLFRPSLNGYRLAFGYFRVVKGGGERYEKSYLVRLAGRSEDCSLDSPYSYGEVRIRNGVKTGLVWGF